MKIANNGGALSAQDRTRLYQNESVENQNRASAEASSRLEIPKDSVEIRTNAQVDLPALENLSLDDILTKLTSDIFSDDQQALAAQGNLDPVSVLSLLED